MKIKFSVLIMIISFTATAQSWQWSIRGGSDGTFQYVPSSPQEQVRNIEIDSEGNIYMLAPIGAGNADIDGVPKQTYSTTNPLNQTLADYVIASFTCSGNYRWSKVIGGYGDDIFQRMCLDGTGNVYSVGKIFRPGTVSPGFESWLVHFDNDTILPESYGNVNENKRTLVINKYSSEGVLQWIRMPEPEDVSGSVSATNYRTVDLSVDPQGNSYWLCKLPAGPIADGQYIVPESGGPTFHILKYDAEGNFTGGIPLDMQIEGGANIYFKMVRNHTTGTFYFAGYLYGDSNSVTVGGQEVEHFFYLAAFDSTGQFLWKRENTSTFELDFGFNDIKLDESGNIYLTGGTTSGDSFNGQVFTSQDIYPFPFVMKLDADGNTIWATSSHASSPVHGTALAITENEVAITGQYRRLNWDNLSIEIPINTGLDIYMARFNRETGAILGLEGIPSYNLTVDEGTALTADTNGNFYLGGMFEYQLYINGETLFNDGNQTDFFIAKYGEANCDCEAPVASFTATPGEGNGYNFAYTGSEGYESLEWTFGDGGTSAEESPEYEYTQAGTYQVCLTVNSADCGSDEYCAEVSPSLSTAGTAIKGLKIYPNPVEEQLQVDINQEGFTYTVYNILGSAVQTGNLSNGHNIIDFGGLQRGVYMLKLSGANTTEKAVRIVKK